MEDGLPGFKGADIAEDISQNLAGFEAVLSHTVAAMGVRSDCDDLATQFLEAAEDIGSGKITAAAVHAAGVHFQSLAFFGNDPQDFVNDLPVVSKRNRPVGRMRLCLEIGRAHV